MSNYKQTAEYAFDLLRHFYELHLIQIEKIGKENLVIYIPKEIYELLVAKVLDNDTMKYFKTPIYPKSFMGIDIRPYEESRILFALKEIADYGYIKE